MMRASKPFIGIHYNVSKLISNPARKSIQVRIRQLQILYPDISQQKLADRLQVPRRTLRRWLSGETKQTTRDRDRIISRVTSYERQKTIRKLPYLKPLPIIPRLISIIDGVPYLDLRQLTNIEILLVAAAAGNAGLRIQFQVRLAKEYFDRDGRSTSVIQTKPLDITSEDLQTEEDVEYWLTQIYGSADRETDKIEAARIKP